MDEKAKKTTKFEVTFNENYTEATIIFEKKMELEIEKKEEKIELISGEDNTVLINSKINEIFATSEVTQVFTNTLSQSLE